MKLLFILFFVIGCSHTSQTINKKYLPLYYQSTENTSLIKFEVDSSILENVYKHWMGGEYNMLLEQQQPLSKVKKEEIKTVFNYLLYRFDVFYILKNMARLPCTPMRKEEVIYSLNFLEESRWDTKLHSILLITLHQIALDHNLIPVFPRIISPYLRKSYNLKQRNPQLYSRKMTEQQSIPNGFLICRKNKS